MMLPEILWNNPVGNGVLKIFDRPLSQIFHTNEMFLKRHGDIINFQVNTTWST
jgi:hypothetical protein